MRLNGKRILFIAPSFFGYEKKIKDKLQDMGAMVDFFDERSITKAYQKALLKISPQIFYQQSINYYEDIIQSISNNKYDYIFVIKCEMMPVKIIKKLKNHFSNALLCLYLYDSLNNIRGIKAKLQYFDRVLSFDLEDTKANANIIFRPLFFTDDYKGNIKNEVDLIYDLSFIGTIHSDRYKIIKKIKNKVDIDKDCYFYCYLQSIFMFYFYRFTKKEFWNVKKEEFQFDKIESKVIAEIIDKTKVVIDIQHPNQTGLTMRTIEMIGMNKKLITTNQSIKEYDFYDPLNIMIIDRDMVDITSEIFERPFNRIDEAIYIKYSLEEWVKDVLGLEDE
jgi:hypothetical protein